MRYFAPPNKIKKREKEEAEIRDQNITDAEELIAQLIEENELLKADLAEQIGDLQELTAEILEGGI